MTAGNTIRLTLSVEKMFRGRKHVGYVCSKRRLFGEEHPPPERVVLAKDPRQGRTLLWVSLSSNYAYMCTFTKTTRIVAGFPLPGLAENSTCRWIQGGAYPHEQREAKYKNLLSQKLALAEQPDGNNVDKFEVVVQCQNAVAVSKL